MGITRRCGRGRKDRVLRGDGAGVPAVRVARSPADLGSGGTGRRGRRVRDLPCVRGAVPGRFDLPVVYRGARRHSGAVRSGGVRDRREGCTPAPIAFAHEHRR